VGPNYLIFSSLYSGLILGNDLSNRFGGYDSPGEAGFGATILVIVLAIPFLVGALLYMSLTGLGRIRLWIRPN
jgi:hypothetical protein